jgi:hypothetical protein
MIYRLMERYGLNSLTFDPAKLVFSIAAIVCAATTHYTAGIILAVSAGTVSLGMTWRRL